MILFENLANVVNNISTFKISIKDACMSYFCLSYVYIYIFVFIYNMEISFKIIDCKSGVYLIIESKL